MAKKTSKTQQNSYAQYKTSARWKTNRERKLLKQLKNHPNNLQIEAAIKNISYRRKTPKSKQWTSSKKATAQLIKEFCGKCPSAVFSPSREVAQVTLQNIGKPVNKNVLKLKVSFALGDRV